MSEEGEVGERARKVKNRGREGTEEPEEEGEIEEDDEGEGEEGSDAKAKRVREASIAAVARARVPRRRRSSRIAERREKSAWQNQLAWSWIYSAVAAANGRAEGSPEKDCGGNASSGDEKGGVVGDGGGEKEREKRATGSRAGGSGGANHGVNHAAVAEKLVGVVTTASGRAARRSVTALAHAPVLRHSGSPGIMLMLQPQEVVADFLAITGQPPPPAKKTSFPRQHFLPFQVHALTFQA